MPGQYPLSPSSSIPRFVAFHRNTRLPIRQFTSLRHLIAWLAFVAASALLIGSALDLWSQFTDTAIPDEPEPTATIAKVARYVPPATASPSQTSTATSTATRKPTATATRSVTPTRRPTRTATLKPSPTAAQVRSQVISRNISATLMTTPTATIATPVDLGQSYGLLTVLSPSPSIRLADVNLSVRGFVPNGAMHALVDYAGEADNAAPQLAGLFADNRTPSIGATYQVYGWSSSCDCREALVEDYDVTLVGLSTIPGEVVQLPDSGYDIGSAFDALVVYADAERIVATYTLSDSVIRGYALYVEGVAVDGDLVAAYQQASNAGRNQLPALRAGQPFGRAKGTELRVAIRDSGAFMDPRSRKDWWRGR